MVVILLKISCARLHLLPLFEYLRTTLQRKPVWRLPRCQSCVQTWLCVFMCDSLRGVKWSCSKSPVSRRKLLAIEGRPKEKVRDETLLCSGTTEQKQTREEEQSCFHTISRSSWIFTAPGFTLFHGFSAVNAKIIIVANTRRQPLAYLTPHYYCRGPHVHVACFSERSPVCCGHGLVLNIWNHAA